MKRASSEREREIKISRANITSRSLQYKEGHTTTTGCVILENSPICFYFISINTRAARVDESRRRVPIKTNTARWRSNLKTLNKRGSSLNLIIKFIDASWGIKSFRFLEDAKLFFWGGGGLLVHWYGKIRWMSFHWVFRQWARRRKLVACVDLCALFIRNYNRASDVINTIVLE